MKHVTRRLRLRFFPILLPKLLQSLFRLLHIEICSEVFGFHYRRREPIIVSLSAVIETAIPSFGRSNISAWWLM
jgi:hypothetical protein